MIRCRRNLASDRAAMAYLRDQRITDDDVIADYRLGVGDDGIPDDFDRDALRDLGLLRTGGNGNVLAGGLSQFTFDPREPEQPVGVVRLAKAQNRHAFATAPTGLGCTADIGDHARLVLADNPLLTLHLAQAGVPGLALVEDLAVLPPLRDWLAARDLVAISSRQKPLVALHGVLTDLGLDAEALMIRHPLASSPVASLTALGLDRDALAATEDPTPEITAKALHDLHAFAVGRLHAGEAAEALDVFEADVPELIQAYAVGYLPANYQSALSRPMRRMFAGQRLGNCLIIPATDEQGAIVDLLALRAHSNDLRVTGCFDQPRGLLGAGVVAAADQLIVTDTLRWAARLMRQGYRDLQLVRGPADAKANAARIAVAGVRQVTVRARRHADEIAAALRSVGLFIAVEREPVTGDDHVRVPTKVVPPPTSMPAPQQPRLADGVHDANATPVTVETGDDAPDEPAIPPLLLVELDAQQDVGIFEAGPVRYAVELGDADQPQRSVTVRRGGATHQDRIKLNVRAQVERFAASASRRVDLPPTRILGHLHEAWTTIREHEEAADSLPVVVLDEAEQDQAEALLRDPSLLHRVADDLTALGWPGEDRAKGLLYLAATSRLLPRPLWAVYLATAGAAPWQGLGLVASLMPPEACVVFHRLTETSLRQAGGGDLRHKLLLVDRAETLRPEGAIALRSMQEWGSVGWQQVRSAEGDASQRVGLVGEARGPVAVLAAAAGDLDRRCRDCFLHVTVDESPEQTAQVLAAQRQQHARSATVVDEVRAIIDQHHAIQRLLRPAAVVIPFAERIAFPMTSIRHRDEFAAFLTLIEASALLHQFQRERDGDGAVIAAEADFAIVRDLTQGLLGAASDGLSRQAGRLLGQMWAAGSTDYSTRDVAAMEPDWTRWVRRSVLQELADLGYIEATGNERGGRGHERRYLLRGEAAPQRGQVHLRPTDRLQSGEVAVSGGVPAATLSLLRERA